MQALFVYGSMMSSGFTSATLLPGTSEVLLVSLIAAGKGKIWLLVLVAGIGNLAGSLVNYVLGIAFMRFQDRRWFPVTAAQIDSAQSWYQRYGQWSLLFAWLPVIGDPLTLVAGLARVQIWRFVILTAMGKFGRYAFLAWGTDFLLQG